MDSHNNDGPALPLRKLLLSHGVLFNNEGDSHVKAYMVLNKRLQSGTREEINKAVDKMREELSKVKLTSGKAAIDIEAVRNELVKINYLKQKFQEISQPADSSKTHTSDQTSKNEEALLSKMIDNNVGKKSREAKDGEFGLSQISNEKLESVYSEATDEVIKQLNKELHNEKERFDELKKKHLKLEDELNQIKRGTLRIKADKKEHDLIAEKQKLQNDLDQALKDKNFWIQRVSKLAGVKMTDKNPGIADLSDPNRPMKLAERCGELYDNQWTNAFESLNEGSKTEEERMAKDFKIIQKLLKILDDIYKYCTTAAQSQIKSVTSAVFMGTKLEDSTQTHLPLEVAKQIKDLQRATALRTVTSLKRKMMTAALKGNEPPAVTAYRESCMDLCWLMVVQDPPVCFYRGDETMGSTFDSNRFVFYTKSGTKLHYRVWPALLLHENGPILRKGVAQPL